MTTTSWEPPLAGTEAEHVVGSLDRLRATFRWKADGLDRIFTVRLTGEPFPRVPAVHGHDGSDDWEFGSSAADSPKDLYAFWDDAVARSRARLTAVLAEGGLDQLVHQSTPDGRHASLRRLLFDLIEEYGRHTGHADLLRETVDGRVGEDVPADWQPVGAL